MQRLGTQDAIHTQQLRHHPIAAQRIDMPVTIPTRQNGQQQTANHRRHVRSVRTRPSQRTAITQRRPQPREMQKLDKEHRQTMHRSRRPRLPRHRHRTIGSLQTHRLWRSQFQRVEDLTKWVSGDMGKKCRHNQGLRSFGWGQLSFAGLCAVKKSMSYAEVMRQTTPFP